MSTLLDTNALIYLLDEASAKYESCLEKFEEAKAEGQVIISDIVYSELSIGMDTVDQVDEAVASLSVSRLAYTNEVLFRAGRAFKRYRQETEGQKNNVLPDFLVGAQAEVTGMPLITGDAQRIRTYFPHAQVVEP